MPHISLKSPLPGMTGLLQSRPVTAKPLQELAQALLRDSVALAPGEGESIAAYVSLLNQCEYCSRSHAAAASILLQYEGDLLADLGSGCFQEKADSRLRALLRIAAQVRATPSHVDPADIAAARAAGAGDDAVHDTVLIAAAFCMYNRYVDGLGTALPDRPEAYQAIGKRLAGQGYIPSPQ